jgi:hypothetical protein
MGEGVTTMNSREQQAEELLREFQEREQADPLYS